MHRVKIVTITAAALLVTACSSGLTAGLRTLQEEVMPNRLGIRDIELKPGFRYLLVQNKNQEALMVWVGNERGPLGESTVWVSSDGVILRLVHGRLVGVDEPTRSWRLTSETIEETSSTGQIQTKQTTDEQPGFRMGITKSIEKNPLSLTQKVIPWMEAPKGLRWVEEIDSSSGQHLAVHGMNEQNHTVAGQRCLTPEWCLRWQEWPAMKATSSL